MRSTFSCLPIALAAALLLAPASAARAATGNLPVFDEALANGSDCSLTAGQPGFPVRIGYTTVVHTGMFSVAVQNYSGVAFGWCPSVGYSIDSDYDGIDVWVNGGTDGGESVDLILGAVADVNPVASATLAELYGAPLPVDTWVHIRANFSKLPFVHPSGTTDFNRIYFSVNSGSSTNFFFLDDIFLTGADIFKDSFDQCTGTCPAGDVLLISQVQTRGDGGGNDEFVELYNPGASPVTFDGNWTLLARSSTAASYTSRYVGANQSIPAHGHILLAGTSYNGSVAADASLSSGITDASSVVLQHNGSVVDALCFYFDATTQAAFSSGGFACEGTPVSNLPHNNVSGAGDVDVSLERKPGGSGGNAQDTGDNAADFASAVISDPHDLASPAVP